MRYAIPDIHGCLAQLKNLTRDQILTDDQDPEFVFLGDYADRGPNSCGVIKYLIDLRSKYRCTFLRGNHDDVLLYILTGESWFDMSYYVGKNLPKQVMLSKTVGWWKEHGLKEFLASYGLAETAGYEEIREVVPKEHVEFLTNTNLFHVETRGDRDFVFVHAFYDPRYNMATDGTLACAEASPKQNQDKIYGCLWQKPALEYLAREKDWTNTTVVLGHTPTSHYNADKSFAPYAGNQVIMLDTGVCFGGNLAAYCIDTDRYYYSEE